MPAPTPRPSSERRSRLPPNLSRSSRKVVYLDDERRSVWSICGAGRTQTPANDCKHYRFESPAIPCDQPPVKRTFATACQRLPSIPSLSERGSTSWLRKEIESREPEGT